jgi:hypothetical protein
MIIDIFMMGNGRIINAMGLDNLLMIKINTQDSSRTTSSVAMESYALLKEISMRANLYYNIIHRRRICSMVWGIINITEISISGNL